ncbi:MAG: carboxypeptidase-like regulatory domain-containing protein [Bacteroidia bacterium]
MKNITTKTLPVLALAFAALAIMPAACKKEKNEIVPDTAVVVDAVITGRVHTPTNTAVGAATIIAGTYQTKSDKDGLFSLSVSKGDYTVIIQTGSGHIFKTEIPVTVSAKETVALTESQTLLVQIKPMAYIPGAYDEIETIIIDSLGYAATQITYNDLDNLNYIKDFGGLFFNCSSGWVLDSLKYTNLEMYVNNWGSIYASDFAVEYLTGDGNWRLANTSNPHPAHRNNSHEGGFSLMSTCITPMLGGFLPDSSLCASKSGSTGMVANADIYDPDIITLLGKDSIDIYYDLGGWEVISIVDAPFTTIIEDNSGLNNGPLAVTCELNGAAVGGKIFYTTFHNHPQGSISPDIKNVLQYFILNL